MAEGSLLKTIAPPLHHAPSSFRLAIPLRGPRPAGAHGRHAVFKAERVSSPVIFKSSNKYIISDTETVFFLSIETWL